MNRSRDLDTIAPDDPFYPPKKTSPKNKKSSLSKRPSLKKSQASSQSDYRQQVYRLLENQTKTPLSSLIARPRVFSFDSRHSDEEIILVLRRHWFTNLSWIILTILMLLSPIFISATPLLDFFPDKYHFVFIAFWYLITFAIAFEKFISWYFNVFILTEERVIDIDFDNLLYKHISETQISLIQDVTVSQSGVSQTLFNYGSVFIQTAAQVPRIEILKVPNPNLVLKVIQQMRGEEELESLQGRIK